VGRKEIVNLVWLSASATSQCVVKQLPHWKLVSQVKDPRESQIRPLPTPVQVFVPRKFGGVQGPSSERSTHPGQGVHMQLRRPYLWREDPGRRQPPTKRKTLRLHTTSASDNLLHSQTTPPASSMLASHRSSHWQVSTGIVPCQESNPLRQDTPAREKEETPKQGHERRKLNVCW